LPLCLGRLDAKAFSATIQRMWTLYKRTLLQEGLDARRRNHVQVLAQTLITYSYREQIAAG
jgi:hypothetical protein